MLENKMRVLSLSTLFRSDTVLTYAQIASHILVKADRVEYWVIQGIQGGLYEVSFARLVNNPQAKMNQLTQSVTIKRVCSRSGFGAEEWTGIAKSIDEVSVRLSAMMEVVSKAEAHDISEVVGR
jgi:hypothetical protein